jgi:hypothetical protein
MAESALASPAAAMAAAEAALAVPAASDEACAADQQRLAIFDFEDGETRDVWLHDLITMRDYGACKWAGAG